MSLTFIARLARTCARPSQSFKIVGSSRYLATKTPSFPIVPECPSPTCKCASTPAMPDDLPIDHKTTLNGLISNYSQQVLVCTGKDDWPSKIETEDEGNNLAADLRKFIGPKGVYSDVSPPYLSPNSRWPILRNILFPAVSQHLRPKRLLPFYPIHHPLDIGLHPTGLQVRPQHSTLFL